MIASKPRQIRARPRGDETMTAETIGAAERIAQNALENIRGKLFFRKDIGTAVLIQKRIDHMKELRNSII